MKVKLIYYPMSCINMFSSFSFSYSKSNKYSVINKWNPNKWSLNSNAWFSYSWSKSKNKE